jgi:hypothetical protein
MTATNQKFSPSLQQIDVNITEDEAAFELSKLRPMLTDDEDNDGLVDRDQIAVKPGLQCAGDIGADMGFGPVAKDGIRAARNALLLSLRLAAADGAAAMHYSRNRNNYVRSKCKIDYWTYANMRAAADSLLARPDLVLENRARPQNPYAPNFSRRRSVLFIGPGFIDAMVSAPTEVFEGFKPADRIILRDRNKRKLPVPPQPIVDETVQFLEQFDAAIANVEFAFSDPEIRWISNSLAVGRDNGRRVLINLERRYLARIFSNSLRDGGRFYRAFWLEMPRAIRRSLLIDGAPTAEHDYAACHLRLAYFAVGESLPPPSDTGSDHYTLEGYGSAWRRLIKRGVSILLNARSYVGAVGALAGVSEMPSMSWDQRLETAAGLIAGIRRRHEALAPLWHSGCGLGLQHIDSQLTILCATDLIKRGIVALPIHDSMLARTEHLPIIKEVMERHFEESGPQFAAERFSGLAKRKARGLRGHDLTVGRILSTGSARVCLTAPVPPHGSPNPLSVIPSSLYPAVVGVSEGPVDLSALVCDPIMRELVSVIAHLNWVRGGIVRSALLTAAPIYGSRQEAARAIRAWIAQTIGKTSARVEPARVDREVERFLRREPRPITPQAIARLCGISSKLATRLGLTNLCPPKRMTSLSRRTKRMATTLPRIIDIKAAAPWGPAAKRASWWATHPDPVDRQVQALRTVMAGGDAELIANVRKLVDRASSERASLPSHPPLPVDRLLFELKLVIALHSFGLSSSQLQEGHRCDYTTTYDDQTFGIEVKVNSSRNKEDQRWAAQQKSMITRLLGGPLEILTL